MRITSTKNYSMLSIKLETKINNGQTPITLARKSIKLTKMETSLKYSLRIEQKHK